MKNVLASDARICKLALDTIVQNGDTLVIDLLKIHIEILVSRTYELPRLTAPHLASETADIEWLGLDTENILLTCYNDTVILISCKLASCHWIHESVRRIVREIEVCSSKTFQRLRIAYCDLDGIDHKASDIAHLGVCYDVLNNGWLLRAATRS